jgi:hypothetical protein
MELTQASPAVPVAGERIIYFARLVTPRGVEVGRRDDAARLGVATEFDHIGRECLCLDRMPSGPDGFPPLVRVCFPHDGFQTWVYQEELAFRPL